MPNSFDAKETPNRSASHSDQMCLPMQLYTVMRIIKLNSFSGSGAVPVNWYVIVFEPRFAIFKNVVHSLKPGETPSNSASHQVPNYAQRS